MQGQAVLLLKGIESHLLPPVTGSVLPSSDLMAHVCMLTRVCVCVHNLIVELEIVLDGISSLKHKSIMLRDN